MTLTQVRTDALAMIAGLEKLLEAVPPEQKTEVMAAIAVLKASLA